MNDANIDRAEQAASTLLHYFGVTRPEDIVVEDMAWNRGIQIVFGPIDGAEAWLIRKGNRGIVRVSDIIREEGRRRFCVGHELGHWELHADISQAWVSTTGDVHAYRGSRAEIEANAFASQLLMPKSFVTPRLLAGVCLSRASAIADEFRTTLTASAVRMVDCTAEDCYVVFSKDNQVKWWRRSSSASMWIEKGHRVHPDSLAANCDLHEPAWSEPAEVKPWLWFPRDSTGVELYEESRWLSEYETVITLLIVV